MNEVKIAFNKVVEYPTLVLLAAPVAMPLIVLAALTAKVYHICFR